uniref:Photosystem I reaction center subunit III n=1 Tax=Gracilaria vermiculophylla TaxID=2608709 RepID=A0A345U8S0_9FLOR|nr:photosystem I reaction center subunit III [Gracilaria vermiculophylla]AXI96856.1 photosystem I reaction center subunit III [Gracilaria vermiculophylla]QXU75070.1 photosystem I reaction center subunit III [Gracilaria vermiculophylla]WDZ67961.1 photosystem I reaction center subunit III [Gracilaria vermiculophylla]
MKKIFTLICMTILCTYVNPINSLADTAGLTKCAESPVFTKRLNNSIKKLETRIAKYNANTPPAIALEKQINRTKLRFDKYAKSGILCGTDGLPHLITDGRWNHAGEFMIPGILFLYITGWIGWVGRGYLQNISKTNKPTEKEIILDVPLALKYCLSGFTWPLAAIKEFTTGDLIANNTDIPISPR